MKNSIYVTRPLMPPYEEYIEEIRELWDSQFITNFGSKHRQLEKQLTEYLEAEHLLLYANGHLALEGVLRALGRTGEVITTPFTFASTTHAITRCGMKPVFCDIKKSDYTMNPDKIEALITEETCAILPVHVYGNLCDMEAIERIAEKYNLPVIYDASHTFGVKSADGNIYKHGLASVISFHATKLFHTVEGSAIICRDEALRDKLFWNRNYGIVDGEHFVEAGGNAKMSEFHAAMGLCNMRHVEDEIIKRHNAAEMYREELSGLDSMILPPEQPGAISNHAYYPVYFTGGKKTRDRIDKRLAVEDIHGRKYFFPLTCDMECYEDGKHVEVPVARQISEGIYCLPLYGSLNQTDIKRICRIIRSEVEKS